MRKGKSTTERDAGRKKRRWIKEEWMKGKKGGG